MTEFNTASLNAPSLSNAPFLERVYDDVVYTVHETVDWLGIVCQLRCQNRELLKTITRLERSLIDCQQQLQGQIQRSQDAGNSWREEAERAENLARQLEISQEEARQQQLQVEILAEQLATSQEHIAQLEEHCLSLQQNCQIQGEILETDEGQIWELPSLVEITGDEGGQQQEGEGDSPLFCPRQPWLETEELTLPFPESLSDIPLTVANWSVPILPPLSPDLRY